MAYAFSHRQNDREHHMATPVQQILDSFSRLPETDRRFVAAEIIRHTVTFDLPALSDEELVLNAEDLFLELDRREAADKES
jgi:hypothetical protein